MATVLNSLLKWAVSDLRQNGKIDTTTETSLENYIDDINNENYDVLGYSEFDQTNSTDWTFDDVARTATYSSGGDVTIQTNSTDYSNCKLKAIIVDTNAAVVSYQISTDGTNFFAVDYFESNETLSSTTIFQITSSDAVIRNIAIVYEKLES